MGSKVGRWLLGTGAGALLLLAGWAYVSHLNHTIETNRVTIEKLMFEKEMIARNADALALELTNAVARLEAYQSIKDDINAAPSGTVPPDIRTALERLRDD